MAEEGQQQESGSQQGSEGNSGGGQGAITQEQMNKLLAAQKRDIESQFAGYDDLKAKAEQLDQLTASAKSDLQRATDEANDFKSKHEAAQGTITSLQTRLLRQEIAAEKNLPAKLWKRVGGTTKEEIEADVEDLLSTAGTSPKQKPQLGALKSGASAPDGMNKKERAAAALRGMNR